MTDIFLSYNREDQTIARYFAKAFEGQGYRVWWDTTLRAGDAYDEVTEAALRSAKAVVVLWSQKSVASRWVRAEALQASRNKTLVPCMIEACERPLMFELTQTAELYNWKGNVSDPRWKAFLIDVQTLIANRAAVPSDQTPLSELASAASKPEVSRRTILLAGSLGVATIVTTGIWLNRDKVEDMIAPTQATNSIAVLPFINIGGDNGQSYFADGLSAEVRGALAGNAQLLVAAQTSSEVFKGRTETPQTMSRKLGVAFLLDGNVRKEAGKARVFTELIDGVTGLSKWSQVFDRPLDDIFAVQSEIAQAVVTALIAKLPAQPEKKTKAQSAANPANGSTTNVAAFEAFLRGRALYESALSEETDRQALAAFDQAIALDPNYAAAHARRARALAVLANQSNDINLILSGRQKSVVAARRAVELAPTFADGYSALGFVLFTTGLDAREAKPAFDKSLQYGAGDGDVLTGFAMFCGRTGRKEEAKQTILRAMERDPLNPTVFRCAGQISVMERNYAAALPHYERALAKNPNASTTYCFIGMALLFLGRLGEARAAFVKEPSRRFALPGLAIIEHKEGRKVQAQEVLATLVKDYGDACLFQQAQVHAMWGAHETALTTLERAYILGDSGLSSLYTDPCFDEIRSEARFSQLLKTIGFE